jgi:hypothetical protein
MDEHELIAEARQKEFNSLEKYALRFWILILALAVLILGLL